MLLCRSIAIFCVDFVCTNGFIMKYKSESLVERAIRLNQKDNSLNVLKVCEGIVHVTATIQMPFRR